MQQGQKDETLKFKLVATQKTFIFKKGLFENKQSFAERVDKEVNPWLLLRSNDGTPATLGKVSCNHKTGEMFYIFLYSRKIEIKK